MSDAPHRSSPDDVDARLLVQAMQEARRSVKLLARVVEAAGAISTDAAELDRIAVDMQELAFQTWLLAAQARAEASRLTRLSNRGTPAPHLGDAS